MASVTQKVVDTARNVLSSSSAKATDLERNTRHVEEAHKLTNDDGLRIDDTDTWLKAGPGGPALLEDQIAREKIMRFDHERIPERVVHARGTAAHGYFRVLDGAAAKYTHAGVLTDPSRKTPVFVRFSTVQGSRGSADTVRDVRGFAIKFYTEEGNWDMVGNDIPVFFIQDAIKFPDFVHSVKPEPHNEVPQGQSAHNNFWDFTFLQPESTHMVMWVMSDRGIPRSYRMMQGFGVNTYTLVNKAGERHLVKFHLFPTLGVHSLTWDEALKICGQDPDFHRKDLEEAIKAGAYPTWRFGIQVIPESEQDHFDFDPLDATKIWPTELIPILWFGELTLDRMPDEYFPEVEQVAFCTSHVVPGIGFSDDPILQGRNFSYFDTQLSRLGINWKELPINRPVCPVMNFQRDGQARHTIYKGQVNYWPNRHNALPPAGREDPVSYSEFPQPVNGVKARMRRPKFGEHIKQAQLFVNSLTPIEKLHLTKAISFELSHCDDPVVWQRWITRLADVDINIAREVAQMVGADPPVEVKVANDGRRTAYTSQIELLADVEPSIKSRRIALLVDEGTDIGQLTALKTALGALQATVIVVGAKRGIEAKPEHHLEGQRSTLFDAILIPGGDGAAQKLARSGRAVHWVREAFAHCKPIGALGAACDFISRVVMLPQTDVCTGGEAFVDSRGVVSARSLTSGETAPKIGREHASKGFMEAFVWRVSQHRVWERELEGLTDLVAY